jgi:hypothetical protein
MSKPQRERLDREALMRVFVTIAFAISAELALYVGLVEAAPTQDRATSERPTDCDVPMM